MSTFMDVRNALTLARGNIVKASAAIDDLSPAQGGSKGKTLDRARGALAKAVPRRQRLSEAHSGPGGRGQLAAARSAKK